MDMSYEHMMQQARYEVAAVCFVKADHCTALPAVQHPSITPTSRDIYWQ